MKMGDKEIIVLGDVEMGAGNPTDDFISDNALSNLISGFSNKIIPIDLVFNGDTFDFLKCPYFVNGKSTYPRHITKQISLAKLKLIVQAHEKVFQSLRFFLKNPNNNVYFILGNHDQDLVFKSVQKEIKKILNNHEQVNFPGLKYRYSQVYVEHGHQYDFLNKINLKHSFLIYKNEKILNIPWVSFGLISRFMSLKEKHPMMERIFPRLVLFSNHSNLRKKITHNTLKYFVKSMVYFPFRYRLDPTYNFPRELLREFYRRVKKVHWDVDEVVPIFKRKRKRSLHKNKIYILGHVHEKFVEEKKGRVIIHPGSWRDEYDLKTDTGKLIPRPKRYVHIIHNGENFNYELVELQLKKNQYDFNRVMNDEFSYLRKSAQEEGFKPIFY